MDLRWGQQSRRIRLRMPTLSCCPVPQGVRIQIDELILRQSGVCRFKETVAGRLYAIRVAMQASFQKGLVCRGACLLVGEGADGWMDYSAPVLQDGYERRNGCFWRDLKWLVEAS